MYHCILEIVADKMILAWQISKYSFNLIPISFILYSVDWHNNQLSLSSVTELEQDSICVSNKMCYGISIRVYYTEIDEAIYEVLKVVK